MDRLGMSEHEAFKMIQRASMRRRVNMRDVADRIIGGSLDGLESTR
jgi:AmiR/NasT family two-component response regulator